MSSFGTGRDGSVHMPPMSSAGIRKNAASTRAQLGLSDFDDQPSGEQLMELAQDSLSPSIGTANVPLIIFPEVLLERGVLADTKYNLRSGCIEIRLSIPTFEALLRNEGRACFTLAHELGHAEQHGPWLYDQATAPVGLARGNSHRPPEKVYCGSEWQANKFAAEFLMPFEFVKRALELQQTRTGAEEELVRHCGVSSEAAYYRVLAVAKELGPYPQ